MAATKKNYNTAACVLTVTPQERCFIELLRTVQYGEVTVQIHQGKPQLILEMKTSIMLK